MAKTPTDVAFTPEAAMEDVTEAVGAIAERGRLFYENALKTWSEEGHAFLETLARDGAAAFEQLQKCKSPLEALGVEQAWLMARSKAYIDAGQRGIEAAVRTAATAANEAPGFRLPD